MKKITVIISFIVISLVSCNKETLVTTQDENETPTTEIVFELTANHPDGATTKAVKTGWEDGDVIFVFFNNVAAPKYLKMSYDGSVWSYTQMNGAVEGSLGLVENATGTMRAVYLPFGNDATVSNDGTSFTFSETTYSYYLTATLSYTVSGGRVSGAFDMQIPEGYIQFFLDDASASSSTEIKLRATQLKPQGIASISANGTITHSSVSSGTPLPGYVYDKSIKDTGESKGYLFSGILAAGSRNVSTTYYFTLISGGLQGTYYSKTFKDKTWYRSATEGRALKMPAISNWTNLSDSYLIYKSNTTIDDSGENYYYRESYLNGFSANVVEMKFQLASSSESSISIACDNLEKDICGDFSLSTTQLVWSQSTRTDDYVDRFNLSEAGVSRTSLMTIRFDGTTNKLSINGIVFDVQFSTFEFNHLFAAYWYERDEGDWSKTQGIPDGSRIYYVKGWDTSGNLIYLGYPVKHINPSSSNEEYCWYTYYKNALTFQYANDAVNQGGYGGYIP